VDQELGPVRKVLVELVKSLHHTAKPARVKKGQGSVLDNPDPGGGGVWPVDSFGQWAWC
jgi:hypothetical protein